MLWICGRGDGGVGLWLRCRYVIEVWVCGSGRCVIVGVGCDGGGIHDRETTLIQCHVEETSCHVHKGSLHA